jgi:hypothetical protein
MATMTCFADIDRSSVVSSIVTATRWADLAAKCRHPAISGWILAATLYQPAKGFEDPQLLSFAGDGESGFSI